MAQESTHNKSGEGGGWISEDWLALILGLIIFGLSLGSFQGMDLLGWGAKAGVWIDPGKAITTISAKYQTVKGEITKIDGQKLTLKNKDGKESTITVEGDVSKLQVGQQYEKKGMSPIMSVALTYLFALAIMTLGAVALGANVPKFMFGFTLAFWLSYLCWFMGHFAYIAATKDQVAKFGIPWSMSMSGEFGFIIALILGLIIGNFFPGLANLMKEAARPELYIKTGIVIMGAGLGIKAAESFGLASNIMFRGFCAIVEAYLIYWAVVYYIARKYFKFSREWSAPLASGISICGVSAAIATGGAIRARPIVPIMVSSLVVIFVAVEMVILPFLAKYFLWTEPLVAGAWMGLAVKSDGGAIASGAITDALIRAQAMDMAGINYAEGWITMTATTVKMFIDIFIGVWAFLLAYIWCAKIDVKPGQKVDAAEIWHRFPKFVIGYVLTFVILVVMCWPSAKVMGPAEKEAGRIEGLDHFHRNQDEGHHRRHGPGRPQDRTGWRQGQAKGRQRNNEGTQELPEQGKILQQPGGCLPGALLPPLLLYHRPGVQLQETDGGGARQAGGGLLYQSVRLYYLGRPFHLMALFPRRQAANNLARRHTTWNSNSSPNWLKK